MLRKLLNLRSWKYPSSRASSENHLQNCNSNHLASSLQAGANKYKAACCLLSLSPWEKRGNAYGSPGSSLLQQWLTLESSCGINLTCWCTYRPVCIHSSMFVPVGPWVLLSLPCLAVCPTSFASC